MVLNMSTPIKMNNNYSISKESILSKYKKMDKFLKDSIHALYGEDNEIKINCFLPCNIIGRSGSNSYSCFISLKKKTGIYLFLNNDDAPVYIGIGGEKVNGQDLKTRLQQEINVYVQKNSSLSTIYAKNTGATLSKNIQEIDTVLENKKVLPDNSIEKIKTFSILTVIAGDINNKEDVIRARALEMVLIALFHPKYNK